MIRGSLAVVETHPIQYRAPLYRALQAKFGIPVSVIYGSDCSITGYHDREFGKTFAWDVDLLSGYDSVFLSRVGGTCQEPSKWAVYVGLKKTLRKLQPSAVLLSGYSPSFHQIAFVQAWRSGLPILFRGETTDHAGGRGHIKDFVRNSTLRIFYKSFSKLLYVGENSFQHFKRLGVLPAKLSFSPYCVDTTAFSGSERYRCELRSQVRNRLGVRDFETVLLFSGKLSPRKGPDVLLSGVRLLPPEIRNRIVVLFLGSGAMQSELAASARQSPSIRVHFAGFQNQRQLSPYYHAADLLVLPSRHSETWGLVVNEALHHGLPCVVSKAVGCAPDLVDPGLTGELFEADSIESFTMAVERALPLIHSITVRERCRQKVSGYTIEKAAEGIARAYWDLVGKDTQVGVHCRTAS